MYLNLRRIYREGKRRRASIGFQQAQLPAQQPGKDKVWEQEKLSAGKMLENGDESLPSSVPL
jgi:hypothetical protein